MTNPAPDIGERWRQVWTFAPNCYGCEHLQYINDPYLTGDHLHSIERCAVEETPEQCPMLQGAS